MAFKLLLLQKIWLVILKKLKNKDFQKYPGLYLIGTITSKPRLVVFDLSDSRFVHIGDSLFFEPIMQFFSNLGASVRIVPTLQMMEYFSMAGYKEPTHEEIANADLLCSTYWMHQSVQKLNKRSKIYFDFSEIKIDNFASTYFIEKLSVLYQAPKIEGDGFKPFKPRIGNKILDNIDGPLIMFNSSVDSGKFRVTRKSHAILTKKVKKLRDLNYKIVAIGSDNENKKCISNDLIDIDLRGKTSVLDIFTIFNNEKVIGSVSYDTAISHIALLYEKHTWIKFRKFRKSYTSYLKKYIFPFYKASKLNVYYL